MEKYEKGKICIIMGVYNGETRFYESIKSIENQTYSNWELIICDDGSNDTSYERLVKYSIKNPKIRVIRNEKNIGLAATLNHCLKYSNGEFTARMDDDDISYPNRFYEQVKYLKEHPEISFISSSADIYNGSKIIGKRILIENPTKKDMVWNTRFIHPATMFRTKDIKAVNGYRVSKDTIRGQDYDLFMRMYGKGYKGANLKKIVFRYTEDNNNIKRRTFKARISECKIRFYGYKEMGVLPWAVPFVLKPFLAYFVMGIKNNWKGIKK